MTLGEKLKEARRQFGWSQEELAEKLYVSRAAVAKWETDNGIPDMPNLKAMSDLLRVSVDYLLDNNATGIKFIIREPININDYGNYAGLLIGQFLYCITYASLVFFVGMSTKKNGLTIAIAIIGPLFIDLLLSLFDSLIKSESFKISNYWLNSFGYDLGTLATSATRLGICITLSLVYAAVFIVAGYFINKNQD